MDANTSENKDLPDGRRQRSERSKQLIIDALIKLIQSGMMSPSAADVAEEARVSLRTVFRHFEDMDALYRGMGVQLSCEILPMVMKPFQAGDWKSQFQELIDRRADIFERIMQIRVCSSLRRFRSAFLMEDHRQFHGLERSGVVALLPDELAADSVFVAALDNAVSFDVWRRMRQEQGMSVAEAKDVVRLMSDSITAGR